MDRSTSYREFWPRYLGEHRRPRNRYLHFLGTCTGLYVLAGAVASETWWLAPVAVVCGYAFAWLAHVFVERNRPATFTHPWWSFVSDFRMLLTWLAGRLPASET